MSTRVPVVLRRVLRRRASWRCEYCLVHERDVLLAHEPDHIIAEKHGGSTVLDNLAWSCFECNHLKSSDIASVDHETGRIVRLFHPRRDSWSKHFRLHEGIIISLTAIGRATENLLQLNRDEALLSRLHPTT